MTSTCVGVLNQVKDTFTYVRMCVVYVALAALRSMYVIYVQCIRVGVCVSTYVYMWVYVYRYVCRYVRIIYIMCINSGLISL